MCPACELMPPLRLSSGSPFEAAIGYARAVVDGEWCWVSGTTGYDYATMTLPDDPAAQAANALRTIGRVLAEAGFALEDVVRVRYYLADRADWPAIVPVLAAAFGAVRPAATMIVCGLMEPAMRIEVEVTAKRPG